MGAHIVSASIGPQSYNYNFRPLLLLFFMVIYCKGDLWASNTAAAYPAAPTPLHQPRLHTSALLVVDCKVVDCKGDLWASNIAAAYEYAALMGAHIVSASIGPQSYSYNFKPVTTASSMYTSWTKANTKAMQPLADKNILLVAAAGNENIDMDLMLEKGYDYSPCLIQLPNVMCVRATTMDNLIQPFSNHGHQTLPNVMCVGATTMDDLIESFSNHGHQTVHIAAPGANILSTEVGSNYTWLTVSYVALYLLLLAVRVKQLLMDTGTVLTPRLPVVSGARLNMEVAVETALQVGVDEGLPAGLPLAMIELNTSTIAVEGFSQLFFDTSVLFAPPPSPLETVILPSSTSTASARASAGITSHRHLAGSREDSPSLAPSTSTQTASLSSARMADQAIGVQRLGHALTADNAEEMADMIEQENARLSGDDPDARIRGTSGGWLWAGQGSHGPQARGGGAVQSGALGLSQRRLAEAAAAAEQLLPTWILLMVHRGGTASLPLLSSSVAPAGPNSFTHFKMPAEHVLCNSSALMPGEHVLCNSSALVMLEHQGLHTLAIQTTAKDGSYSLVFNGQWLELSTTREATFLPHPLSTPLNPSRPPSGLYRIDLLTLGSLESRFELVLRQPGSTLFQPLPAPLALVPSYLGHGRNNLGSDGLGIHGDRRSAQQIVDDHGSISDEVWHSAVGAVGEITAMLKVPEASTATLEHTPAVFKISCRNCSLHLGGLMLLDNWESTSAPTGLTKLSGCVSLPRGSRQNSSTTIVFMNIISIIMSSDTAEQGAGECRENPG
eukprot:gene11848-14953_t